MGIYDRLEAPKNDASADRVNELVTYLSTRKEPQTKHIATVMEMTRQLAAANDKINSLSQTVEMHDHRGRNTAGYEGMPYENIPKTIQLPIGARKVSIEL